MPRERPELFTVEFWQHTVTQAVHGFAGGALAPLVAHQANFIGSVPWYGAAISGALGAGISFLATLLTVRIPDRVPGSFLKETDEEMRMERAILREEELAKTRQRLRERNEEVLVDDRHRAPEPERRDDSLIHGVPPEAVRREEPRAYSKEELPHRAPPKPPPVEKQPTPFPRYDTPGGWQPPPRREEPNIKGRLGDPVPDDMEQWPQGGKRGKQNRGKGDE